MTLDSTIEAQAQIFHRTLNPVLWNVMNIKDDVRTALLAVANAFITTWGFDIPVKDIVLTGSNANYNFTAYSDCDVHVIADMAGYPKAQKDFVTAYLKAQKQLWNLNRKVTVKGMPVELYAQDTNEILIAQGVFSLLNNKWIKKPNRSVPPKINTLAVKAKVESLTGEINDAIVQGNELQMVAIVKRLSDLRKSGLQSKGEFSTENLAFKALRNDGTIGKLRAALENSTDRKLTLESVSHKGPKAKKYEQHKKSYKSKHKGPKHTAGTGGLSSYGRWKKRRVAKAWAWKRSRFAKLAKERPASDKAINRRSYLSTRNSTYHKILGKRQKSKLPYGERARVEKTEKRLSGIYVKNPAVRNRYAVRRRDTTRHSGVSFKNP